MKIMKPIFVLLVCQYLFGCASGAKPENMVFMGEPKVYSAEILENLGVGEVNGGKKTNPAWTSEIDNDAFSNALMESLKSQGLYSDSGNYRLDVDMLKVEQPLFGWDTKVTTHVRYIVISVDRESVVFDETVVTPYTATVDDAFIGVKRLRLANEGSAQKNIEELLNKLSKLQIDSDEIKLSELALLN